MPISHCHNDGVRVLAGVATAPRQAAAAAAPAKASAATKSAASAAAASTAASTAAASTATASTAAASTATASTAAASDEVHVGPYGAGVLFIEDVEGREADVADFFFFEGEFVGLGGLRLR